MTQAEIERDAAIASRINMAEHVTSLTMQVDELKQLVRWMADNNAVIRDWRRTDDGVRLRDAGCGCCADSLDVPANIKATLDSVYA